MHTQRRARTHTYSNPCALISLCLPLVPLVVFLAAAAFCFPSASRAIVSKVLPHNIQEEPEGLPFHSRTLTHNRLTHSSRPSPLLSCSPTHTQTHRITCMRTHAHPQRPGAHTYRRPGTHMISFSSPGASRCCFSIPLGFDTCTQKFTKDSPQLSNQR
jgi:hypothetical protein